MSKNYIEYENRYPLGIIEGQNLLAEFHDLSVWGKRIFEPNDVLLTEIVSEYWSSNEASGPSVRIRYYPINLSIPLEIYVEYKHLNFMGHFDFDPDTELETDFKCVKEMFVLMNLKFLFGIKERHRFLTLSHKLLNKPIFRCSVSEIVYIFENHKEVDYEFGYEPIYPSDELLSKHEGNLKRTMNKYVDFSVALEKRYDIAMKKYLAHRGENNGP